MEQSLRDLFRRLLPLSKEQRIAVDNLKRILKPEQIKDIVFLLKTKKAALLYKSKGVSKNLHSVPSVIQFQAMAEDIGVHTIVRDFNRIVEEKMLEQSYKSFAPKALDVIKGYIAPNILGLEDVKFAATLQLFSTERFHLLLLGDPGTGKTDILRSTSTLAPTSTFGLGSGTSGVGLSVSISGKEVEKGLLVQADKGLCCIDELNLMKKQDMAALYSAMEKGFVAYDKGKVHKTFDARVRIQATANPEGDRFVGKSLSILQKQIPFDSALLTRFHLIFVIRQPTNEQLVEISKKIVRGSSIKLRQEDIDYIRSYISYASTLDVHFDHRYESEISSVISELKENESKYVVEIGPRTVHGLMRLSQAHARLNLRTKVTSQDVEVAVDLLKKSLELEGIIRP